MANGKNFNLFLMDGEATGRIKCTLANWTGIAYKIPRTYLEKSKEIQYLNNSGIYSLLSRNKNDELYVNNTVYVDDMNDSSWGCCLRKYFRGGVNLLWKV